MLSSLYAKPESWSFDSIRNQLWNRSISIEDMIQQGYKSIEAYNQTCLSDCEQSQGRRNSVVKGNYQSSNVYLKGTTYWYNEWVMIGHTPLEVALIKAMASERIDRIILQRALCANKDSDICYGNNVWNTYMKGYFHILSSTFHQDTIVYIRWENKPTLQPYRFTIINGTIEPVLLPASEAPEINLSYYTCFERLLRRPFVGARTVENTLSMIESEAYKDTAYQIATKTANYKSISNNHWQSSPTVEISIIYRYVNTTHRVSIRRNQANYAQLVDYLKSEFHSPEIEFNIFPAPSHQTEIGSQIASVARTHVLISDHGAFQANVAFMRHGSLLIDLVGIYFKPQLNKHTLECPVEEFTRYYLNFGIYYRRVFVSDLKDHLSPSYTIQPSEMQEIAGHIKSYLSAAPYKYAMF